MPTNVDSSPNVVERQSAIASAVEGFLTSMPHQIADAMRAAAIPHWFDGELLGRLCGYQLDMQKVMSSLQDFRLVRQDAQQRFRYHEQVRNYLLSWWRQERLQQYAAANQAALDYFQTLAEAAPNVERPVYQREVLYHLLVRDEKEGFRYLSERFEDACERYQLGLAEGFVNQASQLKDIFSAEGQQWVRYFEARLEFLYRREDWGETIFQDLADHAQDTVLQAVARWSLGEIRVSQQKWSQAIRLYRASLAALQRERSYLHSTRVMLALGRAYRDLAEKSGGFHGGRYKFPDKFSWFLYILQHLPFIIYEWFVHRVRFLPNWYFGTNYQDWIIAYLLRSATRWYRRAEKQLRTTGGRLGLIETQLALAELEHQLGRWSRSEQWYKKLLGTEEIKESLYRVAQVQMGQGRAFLEEGKLSKAENVLARALEAFRLFQDDRSIAITSALLGRGYLAGSEIAKAASAYSESAQAFCTINDQVAHTQVICVLEDLVQHPALPAEQKQQINTLLAQTTERHYITRFPDTLLRRFRRLALIVTLPLTYVLAFVVSLVLTWTFMNIEGELLMTLHAAKVVTTISDALILLAWAILPIFLVLWLNRAIYSFMGITFVRFLGHRLIPIEHDQPNHLITDTNCITLHEVSNGLKQSLPWPEVIQLVSLNYYLLRQNLRLVSSTILTAQNHLALIVDAITAGYHHFTKDIKRHIESQTGKTQHKQLNFIIFKRGWLLAAMVASFVFAWYTVSTETAIIELTWEDTSTGTEMLLKLSPIILMYAVTFLLVFAVVSLWRLISHRRMVRNLLGAVAQPTIPSWMLLLSANGCTALTIIWVIVNT